MSKPPVAQQVQVNFRMPVDLRERVKLSAETNGRSMNAEIIRRLEQSFVPKSPADGIGGFLMMATLMQGMAKDDPSLTVKELLERAEAIKRAALGPPSDQGNTRVK